ncbi:MAG: hypothetical protein ACI837_002010 [Crocinitomicaceae bacterium]|jgi:hypothetical protein
MRTTITCLLALFFAFNLSAQSGVKLKKKSLELTLKVSNGELRVTAIEVSQKEILDEMRTSDDDLKEYIFSDEAFESIPEIEALTLNYLANGKIKREKNTSITSEDYTSRGIFYSGTKRYTVTFPKIHTGSILSCETTIEYKEPRLLPSFYFDDYLPCDLAELIVNVGPGIEIGNLDFHHKAAGEVSYTEEKSDYFTTHTWTASNLPGRTYEGDSRGTSCSSPHTIIHVKSYESSPNEVVNILRNKEDLFDWYSSLVDESELDESDQPILDSLKKRSSTEIELAENIFNWVQHNIKYIAYEDGLGGFVPRTPASVIHNRFGDCKDMALLTKTMMNSCGVPCHVAWVGTRSKCYSYESCPTPAVDNHMIAAYPGADGLIFLDPTSSYSEFGMASSFIQGKEAMVRTTKTDFEIIVVPTASAAENSMYTKLQVKLHSDGLSGSGTDEVSGFDKVAYENALDYNEDNPEQLFMRYSALGNDSYAVTNLKQENTDSNEGVLKSTFDFTIHNYVESFDSTFYFNPFLKDVVNINLSKRKLTLDLDYKYSKRVEVELTIPEGYKVKDFIESVTIEENGFTFGIDAQQDEKLVKISYWFFSNELQIESVDLDAVQKTLKKIKKSLKQQISLTSK